MFAGSIGIVADEEVKCFETFKADLDKSRRSYNADNDIIKPELDIIKEITLLEEVKDIRDELNILRSILGEQKSLLNRLLDLVAGRQVGDKKAVETDPVLNYYSERSDINMRIKKVKKMDADAATTYASINHLLDLKQKHANLSEASQAREQAEQTTKQGRTIMVFTTVTIIFVSPFYNF
ncbi:hypothetical protein HYALB_00010139 [Hymenoscyphus albidus]|uniref:Uncharacterized protein n=1 Tax=Hymenoscyphus albidus TaxID=595503 RepID=A0A9N9L9L5_9HELO|nr:hypothetical protein HYALB_00010139 [Hymenoscyphus albidus]